MALNWYDESGDAPAEMSLYLDTLLLIERLHRRFLDVVKAELDRLGRTDINSVQSLILYNIGEDELTVGELTVRGYYLGSNVSYNVKKLVENGYIVQERSMHDRRSIRVRLSDKGKELRKRVDELFGRQSMALPTAAELDAERISEMNQGLKALERFWGEQLRYRA